MNDSGEGRETTLGRDNSPCARHSPLKPRLRIGHKREIHFLSPEIDGDGRGALITWRATRGLEFPPSFHSRVLN